MPQHQVVLDTDIGSDVDDAMALALLLGTPDVRLHGVTTVYGDTVLRGRIARRYASLAGRQVPVHAGLSRPMSGREVWWAGHEGSLHDDLERETLDSSDAVSYLVRTVAAAPGEIDVLAIGPLTNIAAALAADPQFAANVRTLWVMGGHFGVDEPEHNLLSDTAAAAAVFASSLRTVVCGIEITRQVRIDAARLERIRAAGAVGTALAADIDQWWAFWDEQWNVPHDPVTVLALTRPGLFRLSEPGRVHVERGEDGHGISRFTPDPDGPTRLVVDLDPDAVAEAVTSGIVAAGTAG